MTVPCLVPCITSAAGSAVLLCLHMGLGTMASWSHWSHLVPLVFSISFIKPHSVPADLSTSSVLSLLYPTVLCLLPGEILLLEDQLLRLGGGWLSVKGLERGGCVKQLPFPLHGPAHPRAWLLSASWASAQLSQLCASGWTFS